MNETTHNPGPATSKNSGPDTGELAGERFTRRTVTVILAAIAALTFAFSFRNVWALGLRLGVDPWIAPLVGPAVDLSVVGLLIGIRHLSLNGLSRHQLRPARLLLAFSGTATLALNAAEPITIGAYGRAAFDSVGPLLLIGWSEVGPGLLRQLYTVRPAHQHVPVARPEEVPVVIPLLGARQPAATHESVGRNERSGPRPDVPDDELMAEARRIDAQHRAAHQRPVSAETLRRQLRIGAARARRIVADLRADGHSRLIDEAAV
jgi:hypothetical protein